MSNLFSDQSWQIINAILTLVAIGISIYIFRKQNIKRSLAYIVTERNLLKISEKIKDKIEIRYDNKLLKSAHLIILQVINNGNVEIRADDFDSPLSFNFDEDTTIISTQIIEKNPANLNPVIDPSAPGKITLNPLLLNSGSLFSVELLISGWKEGNYKLVGQIKGGNIIPLKTPLVFMQARVAVAYWLLGVGLIGLIGLIAGYPRLFSGKDELRITPELCYISPDKDVTLSIENYEELGPGLYNIAWLLNSVEVQNKESIFFTYAPQKTEGQDHIEAIIFDGGVERVHLFRECTLTTPSPTITP